MNKIIEKLLDEDNFHPILFISIIIIGMICASIVACNTNYYQFEKYKLNPPSIENKENKNTETITIDGKTYILKKD